MLRRKNYVVLTFRIRWLLRVAFGLFRRGLLVLGVVPEGVPESDNKCRRSFASLSVRKRVLPGSNFPRFNGPN